MARRDTRSFGDTTTDTFPKMGDDGLASVVNVSGQRSAYTMPQARKGPTSPDMGGGNGSARRSATEIHEAHGPTFRPVATSVYDTTEQPRAMRTMPSAVGCRDFWDARASNNEGQVIG